MTAKNSNDMSSAPEPAAVTGEVTLTSPDGRSYVSDNPTEITNLIAAGYARKTKK